jgi:F1F0 ATPase subunit 2
MTTPSDVIALAPALATGVLLGTLFFGGLWWTVRRVLVARLPAAWLLASFVARTAVVLAGFIVVGGNQWQRWLVVLVGFIAARVVVARLLPAQDLAAAEAMAFGVGHHAP